VEDNNTPLGWTSFATGGWGVAGANNRVTAQAIGDDGTRYVAGSFTEISLVTGHGVGLSTEMNAPHALAFPPVNGEVLASTPDSEGGWYIGGRFTQVGEQERLGLAHIDSSGRLTDWNPGVTGTTTGVGSVYSLAI